MNEQQKHLEDLLNQQRELSNIINETTSRLNQTRDNFLRIDGAIQYLTQVVGVTLPESNNMEESSESEDSNSTEG